MSTIRHWASLGEVTCVGGIRVLLAVHRWFGNLPFRLCLYPVVLSYWLGSSAARRASRVYLQRWQRRFGPRRLSSLEHFLRFAEVLLDKFRAVAGRFPRERIQTDGIEAVRERITRGQGGVFVTAHVGCLELCQAAAAWVPELRLTVLVHTRHAERFNALLDRLRPQTQLRLLQVSEVGPATAAVLERCIERGEYVAIVGDRVPVGQGKIVHSDFLGTPAPFPIGPWVLAALLRCPVFLLSCIGSKSGYRLAVTPFRERIELPRGKRAAALRMIINDYARWLESGIASAPYDWFNFFDFWGQSGHELHDA